MNIALNPRQRDFVMNCTNALREIQRRKSRNKFYDMYPLEDVIKDDGTIYYARSKYPKHIEFFRVGATHRERCAMAANRIGKSFGMGGYEMTCHLTGQYPKWWKGRRFTRPVKAWAAGKTNETTRDIIQTIMMGEMTKDLRGKRSFDATGLLPYNTIGGMVFKRSMDLLDTVKVKHKSGGWSTLGFKSYEQGRGAFEGTAQHIIWFDEEPPLDVYGEALIRTATTDGITMLTFTPLQGMSETVMQFIPQSMKPDL